MSSLPLTGKETPRLAHAANIESLHSVFGTVEGIGIARFSTTSERAAAFASPNPGPAVGQVVHVAALGHRAFQVWTGSAWQEVGEYTWLRERTVELPADRTRNSPIPANVGGLFTSVTPGLWRVVIDLHYRGEATAEFRVGFTFPGTDSRITVGMHGRGINATGGNLSATTFSHDTNASRTSGGVNSIAVGCRGESDTLYANVTGTLYIAPDAPAGNLQVQYWRTGSGEVTAEGPHKTLLSIRRIG